MTITRMTKMQIDHPVLKVYASIFTQRLKTFQILWLSVMTLSDVSDKDMLMSTKVFSQCTARTLDRPPLNNSYYFSRICSSPHAVKLLSLKNFLPGVRTRSEIQQEKQPLLSSVTPRPGHLK